MKQNTPQILKVLIIVSNNSHITLSECRAVERILNKTAVRATALTTKQKPKYILLVQVKTNKKSFREDLPWLFS